MFRNLVSAYHLSLHIQRKSALYGILETSFENSFRNSK
jgi:hypothetical protein